MPKSVQAIQHDIDQDAPLGETGDVAYTATGTIRNSPKPSNGYDSSYLSPRRLEEIGFPVETHEPRWIRNDQFGPWKDDPQGPRIQQVMDEYEGARVINDASRDGAEVRLFDLRLMAVPREQLEKEQASLDAEQRAKEDELEEQLDENGSLGSRIDDFDRFDTKRIRAKAQLERKKHLQSGITGPNSPTHKLTLEEAYKRLGTKRDEIYSAIAAEEELYRVGPRRETTSFEGYQAMLKESARKNGATFGMGDVGFGPTLREKVRANTSQRLQGGK